MPKKTKSNEPEMTKAEADKARDAALKQMLKTPPKRHKDEPRRSVVSRKV